MPLDAICLSALISELSAKLTGGRIDKVQQPERDMLLISLRSKGENLRLLISAGTGSARVHLTKASFENPAEPPMFCMLMRKHLVGARIVSVSQPEGERMLCIELDSRDELGFETRKKLIAELIGRSSNLILVDAEGRITDCMRRMDFGGDALRRMLPGMIYRMPPAQTKPQILKTSPEQRPRSSRRRTGTSPLTNGCLTALPDFRRSCAASLHTAAAGMKCSRSCSTHSARA